MQNVCDNINHILNHFFTCISVFKIILFFFFEHITKNLKNKILSKQTLWLFKIEYTYVYLSYYISLYIFEIISFTIIVNAHSHPLWLFIRQHNVLYYNTAIAMMRIVLNTDATDFKKSDCGKQYERGYYFYLTKKKNIRNEWTSHFIYLL
jgi:hypothetical protein